MRTEEGCKIRANQLAKKTGKTYFVVIEGGIYDYCTMNDLDTFYQGIPEQNILYCTDDN